MVFGLVRAGRVGVLARSTAFASSRSAVAICQGTNYQARRSIAGTRAEVEALMDRVESIPGQKEKYDEMKKFGDSLDESDFKKRFLDYLDGKEFTDDGAIIANTVYSLEWAVASPPPLHCFEEPPIVVEWPKGEAGGH